MPRSAAAGGSSMGRPPVHRSEMQMRPDQPSPEEMTLYTTLSAYADALDALPLDLTRSFSDLRELDAVLGAHLCSLTNRLIHLAALIESPDFSPGERIVALKEVAEEARAYKLGGDDKVRVALNTAETIITHTTYIETLLANLSTVPSLAPLLNPPAQSHIAGHLSDGTPLAPGSGPGGNNPANVSSLTEIITPNTNKRKRPAGVGAQGIVAGATLTSVHGANTTAEKGRAQDAGVATQASAPVVKKRKPPTQSANVKGKAQAGAANTGFANSTGSAAVAGHDDVEDQDSFKKTTGVKRRTAREEDDGGRGEESAANARARTARGRGGNARGNGSEDDDDDSEGDSVAGGATNRSARVARAPRPTQASQDAESNAVVPAMMGEDADERRYCFCNNVSYGDMIGCDDDDCEREWFHLGCVGLLKPPQGTWYCDDCAMKRASRNAKSKKTKLAKTSGAHGGGVVETKARVVSSNKR